MEALRFYEEISTGEPGEFPPEEHFSEYPLGNSSTTEVPALPPYIRITSTIFCVVILCVGTVGNILVPIVVWRNKDLRNSTNIFLVNLAIADCLVLLVCLPPTFVELHSDLLEVWLLGAAMCKIVPFAELWVAHASALIILAISLERYIAICRPLKANYTCTKNRAIIICIGIWIVAFIATSPILLITKHEEFLYVDHTLKNACLTSLADFWASFYFVASIILFFIIPLCILLWLYRVITLHLMKDPCNTSASQRCCTSDHPNIRSRKQVVVMLGTVVVFFFVCLLPFRLFWVYIIFAPNKTMEQMGMEPYYNILYICRVMFYLNSATNPILYNVMSSKFRQAFLRVLRCESNSKNAFLRQSTFTNSTTIQNSLKSNKNSIIKAGGEPLKGGGGQGTPQSIGKLKGKALRSASNSGPYYPGSIKEPASPDEVTIHSQNSHLLNKSKIIVRANTVV